MTNVLDRELILPMSQDSVPSAPVSDARKQKKNFSFVQFIAPRKWEEVKIPADTKHLILGIPGFLCTPAALKVPNHKLNADGTMYIDWGAILNIGFTNRSTSYLVDYADYLTQTFGGQIDLHGNSLGGFGALLVGVSNPGTVRRINLTAVPHLLSMDKQVLREHTNIAPFLGLMKSRLLGRFYDQAMMERWEQYRSGVSSDEFDEIESALANVEIASWAAKNDNTVSGKMCGFHDSPNGAGCVGPEAPNRRFFVVEGDHSDVVVAATPIMGFLTGLPLHSQLPAHLQESMLSHAELEELEKKSPLDVAADFVLSSFPQGRVTDFLRSTANTPRLLRERVPTLSLPNIHIGRSRELTPIT